ncbi:hypothetical protein LPY66_15320 [Dehalobacter sp. DCM]|nr:hypothetical protein LPY66_15320 [Dehalobacter sp. DCM]
MALLSLGARYVVEQRIANTWKRCMWLGRVGNTRDVIRNAMRKAAIHGGG